MYIVYTYTYCTYGHVLTRRRKKAAGNAIDSWGLQCITVRINDMHRRASSLRFVQLLIIVRLDKWPRHSFFTCGHGSTRVQSVGSAAKLGFMGQFWDSWQRIPEYPNILQSVVCWLFQERTLEISPFWSHLFWHSFFEHLSAISEDLWRSMKISEDLWSTPVSSSVWHPLRVAQSPVLAEECFEPTGPGWFSAARAARCAFVNTTRCVLLFCSSRW